MNFLLLSTFNFFDFKDILEKPYKVKKLNRIINHVPKEDDI